MLKKFAALFLLCFFFCLLLSACDQISTNGDNANGSSETNSESANGSGDNNMTDQKQNDGDADIDNGAESDDTVSDGTVSDGTVSDGTDSDGEESNGGEEIVCQHTFSEWETVLAPTCTEQGKKERYCTIWCNAAPFNYVENTWLL